MPIFCVRAVYLTPAPLKAISVIWSLTPGDSHCSGIDHVLLDSARDGKLERTGNGAMKVNGDHERT